MFSASPLLQLVNSFFVGAFAFGSYLAYQVLNRRRQNLRIPVGGRKGFVCRTALDYGWHEARYGINARIVHIEESLFL